jgi:hypothetical protein
MVTPGATRFDVAVGLLVDADPLEDAVASLPVVTVEGAVVPVGEVAVAVDDVAAGPVFASPEAEFEVVFGDFADVEDDSDDALVASA